MSSYEKVCELVKAQQGTDEYSHIFNMGEQLKEICRDDPKAAELVAHDLESGGMSLKELENRFDKFAREHKQGSQSCISPRRAEKLIREFYSLPVKQDQKPSGGKVLSLLDLM